MGFTESIPLVGHQADSVPMQRVLGGKWLSPEWQMALYQDCTWSATLLFFFFFKVYFYWRLFYQSGAALVSYNYLWWWKCSIICFIQSDSHESHAAIKHLKCDQCDWETEFLTSFNSFKWPWAASGYSIGHARILDQNEESHKFVNTNQFLKSYVMFTGPWSWRMRDSYAIFWNGTSKKVFSPINRCVIL